MHNKTKYIIALSISLALITSCTSRAIQRDLEHTKVVDNQTQGQVSQASHPVSQGQSSNPSVAGQTQASTVAEALPEEVKISDSDGSTVAGAILTKPDGEAVEGPEVEKPDGSKVVTVLVPKADGTTVPSIVVEKPDGSKVAIPATKPQAGSTVPVAKNPTAPGKVTLPGSGHDNPVGPKKTLPQATSPGVTAPGETQPLETDPSGTQSPQTNPSETQPPQTNPPVTQPPKTNPPETQPPRTNPPETQPPRTNPPETQPPRTNPPETQPPKTKPPVTQPPKTDPPKTKPPVTEPPKTDPPETDSGSDLTDYSNASNGWSHQYPTEWVRDFGGYWRYNTNKVYLTMDHGYEPGYTSEILDVLKDKGVRATFFLTTEYLRNNGAMVKRMVAEGHKIGNHSTGHKNMVDLVGETGSKLRSNTKTWEQEYADLTGRTSKLYRAPEGVFSKRGMKVIQDMGYRTYFWDAAYADWDVNNQPSIDKAKEELYDDIRGGSIILLHPFKTNTEMLPEFIDDMRDLGYEFSLLP